MSTVKNAKKSGNENLRCKLSFFAPNDIFIYAFVVLAIVALFLCFALSDKKTESSGFSVTVNGNEIFSLDYDEPDNYRINEKFPGIIEVFTEKGEIAVYIDSDKKEFNVISFDCKKRTVKMASANCSLTHDCTFFNEISGSGSIICVPHSLTITAISGAFTPTPPVTG